MHYLEKNSGLNTMIVDMKSLGNHLGFERGAEILPDDSNAIHVWVADGDLVIGVGRSHLLEDGNDGSGADIPGKDSGHAPPFGPLETSLNNTVQQYKSGRWAQEKTDTEEWE